VKDEIRVLELTLQDAQKAAINREAIAKALADLECVFDVLVVVTSTTLARLV
jgi:hypothetical protein